MTRRDYPDVITTDELVRQQHIDTATIRADLLDTLREIHALGKMQDADQLLAKFHMIESERKLAQHRVWARPVQTQMREQLAAFLKKLLAARGAPALSRAEFDALPEYSFTDPVPQTPGKMWRRAQPCDGWMLGMYIRDGDDFLTVYTDAREIILPTLEHKP